MEEKRKQLVQNLYKLLGSTSLKLRDCDPVIDLLAGDGSQRAFYRVHLGGGSSVVAILPTIEQQQGMAEAHSSWLIGSHLFSRGVPVPEMLAFDRKSGLILTEDLGDTRLHEYIIHGLPDKGELLALYGRVIRELVRMQVKGGEGFDPSWCWQTPCYDRDLMLERESGYFEQALCRDYFGLVPDDKILRHEFAEIADNAAAAPAGYFLHRDFQSRNIMLQDGRIRIIDFQGGRFGPLGYDLASLLLDPYVSLSQSLQEQLLEEYIHEFNRYAVYNAGQFRLEFSYLALQRNLQMLGAFAFLSKQRGKEFFRPFIQPALFSLQSLLAKPALQKYSALKQLSDQCLDELEKNRKELRSTSAN